MHRAGGVYLVQALLLSTRHAAPASLGACLDKVQYTPCQAQVVASKQVASGCSLLVCLPLLIARNEACDTKRTRHTKLCQRFTCVWYSVGGHIRAPMVSGVLPGL